MSSEKPVFKTRARLIRQLGEQLIKNESIALLELIKNSYDADAQICSVIMHQPDNQKQGVIIIEDDGEGMNGDILASAWLEIGTSYKEDRIKEEGNRSPKFGRLRLGEKGIGRLGIHKLGNHIELITQKKGEPEYILTVDWTKIDKSKYIEDLPVTITSRKSTTFSKGHGTKIIITMLRQSWTKKMARDCSRTITALNSPFRSTGSFRAKYEIPDKDWLDGLTKYTDISQYRLFEFDIIMEGNQISEFDYKFVPWKTMTKLKKRHVTIKDKEISALTRMIKRIDRKDIEIDLGKYEIGKVRFKGVIFDRESTILKMGVNDKAGFKEYLDENGGVQVFRDNMRVLDYGERGSDWLDLGGRRINMPTKRISNNIILGAVYLDRDASDDLIEKSNREGFIENEAFIEFLMAISYAIDRIESLRKTDKDLMRKFYGPQADSEPVLSSITDLREIISEKITNENVKKKMTTCIDRIQREYETITNSLIKSAGAGLNLILVIHQIKLISEDIKHAIKKKAKIELIEERIQTLSALVDGYSILVKQSEIKSRNLKGIINQCIFNMEFRLTAHSINLEPVFRKKMRGLDARCSEDHVLNALMNIFDNSIWWLGYSKTKNPSIFLDISNSFPGYTSIVIADNGPGFTKPTEEIIKPFVSDKPGGMGIGLHLTQQIMLSLGGELLFPGLEIFEIPKKYHNGAIIALAFKK